MIQRGLSKLLGFVFFDPVRVVEVVSAVTLAGWAGLLITNPEFLVRETFSAFSALPAWAWSILMAGTAVIQFFAMVAKIKARPWLRFVAMALAAGIWTIVAFNFWRGDELSTGTAVYTPVAVVSILAGIWLGWASKNSSQN